MATSTNINVKDIKIAGITIDSKTCHCFRATNGHNWYLKGSTLEVTIAQTTNANYIPYTKERLATGRCGKIIGTIKKINTNDDLTANLKILANLPKIEKVAQAAKTTPAPVTATPAAKKPTAKTTKAPKAKPATKKPAAKKPTAKTITPAKVDETPAPITKVA